MAGRKDTERGRSILDWLLDQLRRRRWGEDCDPKFVALYPRLMERAQTLGRLLTGNVDPKVARDVANVFEESAERVASDRTTEATKHIGDLVMKDPDLPSKALRKKADQSIIGDMDQRRFDTIASEARKRLRSR